MGFQRQAKMKPATMRAGEGMTLVQFFKQAGDILKERGEDDAAFYFEQCEEWLREGKQLQGGRYDVLEIFGL